MTVPAEIVGAGAPRSNAASFEAQQARFARRPGAETVVSVVRQDPGKKSNLRDVLQLTPGVYMSDRGENSQGTISIRGSDISQTGPRSGRGVRGYIDGIPLGRIESGISLPILDISAADYLEIYRGATSLRYGALATGGALNLVSKTGLTAPGGRLSGYVGSYGVRQGQVEYGGAKGNVDYYAQLNGFRNDGYEFHSANDTLRFSGNVGWRPNDNIENRTSVAVGSTRQELATQVPLDQIATYRRSGYDPTNASFPYDTRANFDYQRVVNKTVFRSDTTSFEIAPYFLATSFDHLPSPRAGIVDVKWQDVGVATRLEHRTDLFGFANTAIRDSLARQVILTSSDVVRTHAHFNEATYTTFALADAARLGVPRAMVPLDGKSLHLSFRSGAGSDAFHFDGKVDFAASRGGYAGSANVLGRSGGGSIEILAAGQGVTAGFNDVSLADSHLSRVNRYTGGGVWYWAPDNMFEGVAGTPVPDWALDPGYNVCEVESGQCVKVSWLWAAGNMFDGTPGTPVDEWALDPGYNVCLVESGQCVSIGGNGVLSEVSPIAPMFSVVRTGIGDLDLVAGGNIKMRSSYGVYTAGTQSLNVAAVFNGARATRNGTALGEGGADYESLVRGPDATYQAWYPKLGGNLLLKAGGDLSGDAWTQGGIFGSEGNRHSQNASADPANWLWRQSAPTILSHRHGRLRAVV